MEAYSRVCAVCVALGYSAIPYHDYMGYEHAIEIGHLHLKMLDPVTVTTLDKSNLHTRTNAKTTTLQ